ncbi:MAG: hypothetical protein P1U39_01405 [Legionellaceae bacterium]|nr:hypothetical protein [Legionellaceae bacterium]
MNIYTIQQIKNALDIKQDLPLMMQAVCNELIHFSNGESVVPMPLHLSFSEPRGECHVKAGYSLHDQYFVIKIATGFYENTLSGLPAGDGLMLVCCKNTGIIQAVLCDGGYLTLLRTALMACIVAKLTPWKVEHISIFGTGALARRVIEIMHQQYPDINMYLWGRNQCHVESILCDYPYVQREENRSTLVKQGGVVITTTASQRPLIHARDIDKRIHIIALGADQANKQEVDATVFAMADRVMVDCQQQAVLFGDTAMAIKQQHIDASVLREVGGVLQSEENHHARMMISDLTGIAPQDLGIAKYVMQVLNHLCEAA